MSEFLDSLSENDLRKVVRDLVSRVTALEQRTIQVDALDELGTDDLGDMQAGSASGWRLQEGELESADGTAKVNSSVPYIALGATGHKNGIGLWVGRAGENWKLHLGDPSGKYISFDGADIEATGLKVVTAIISDLVTVGADNPKLIVDGVNKLIKSSDFLEGVRGLLLRADGKAEFNDVTVRGEIRASVFSKGEVSATAGTIIIAKGGGKLHADVTTLATPYTFDVDVDDPRSGHAAIGAVGDILRLADGTANNWIEVTAVSDQTTFYRYTCMLRSGSPTTWSAGTALINYGVAGDGFLLMTADDANAPYYSVRVHGGQPWSDSREIIRLGNLSGIGGYEGMAGLLGIDEDGRVQFGLNDQGKAIFAGGKAIIDYLAIALEGLFYGITQSAEMEGVERIGGLGMSPSDNEPALTLTYEDAAGSELAINGDFELDAWWSLGDNWAYTIEDKFTGTRSLKHSGVEVSLWNDDSVFSDFIAVSPGNRYRLSYYAKNTGALALYVHMHWYKSDDTLISTQNWISVARPDGEEWSYPSTQITIAPLLAAKAKIEFQIRDLGTVYLDWVSFKNLSAYSELSLKSQGPSIVSRSKYGLVASDPDLLGINNVRLSLSDTAAISIGDLIGKNRIYAHPFRGNKICLYNNQTKHWEIARVNDASLSYIDLEKTYTNCTVDSNGWIDGLDENVDQLCPIMNAKSSGGTGSLQSWAAIQDIDIINRRVRVAGVINPGTLNTVQFYVASYSQVDIIGIFNQGDLKLGFATYEREFNPVLVDGKYVRPLAYASGTYNHVYLGTVRTVQTPSIYLAETEDSNLKRLLWPYYNRIKRNLAVVDPTDSWTYALNQWRQVRGQASNQVECMIGIDEDPIVAQAMAATLNNTSTQRTVSTGIGLKGSTTNVAQIYGGRCINDVIVSHFATYRGHIGVGFNQILWLERGAGSDTQTWYGNAGNPGRLQTGLVVEIMG